MRIFISHGVDKSSADELALLDGLALQLAQGTAPGAGHDVLLDRTRLDAGDDWQGVLHDWLAECQAAVLLLTPRALQRPWVLKEATILAFRRQRDPAFLLLPVLLQGLTPQHLAAHAGFSALGLDAVQAQAAGADAAALARWVDDKATAVDTPPPAPLDRLQQVLENWISQASPAALDRACQDWLGEPVAWRADIDRARQRARVIARVIARGRPDPTVTLAGMARALTGAALAREPTRKVLDLAASLWVDEEVAARLRAVVACRRSAPVAAVLNSGRVDFGARMAVWRALLPDIADSIYCVAGGASDDRLGELAEGICRAYMDGNKDDIADEDEARDMLQVHPEPVFFVLPPPVPDAALLQDLHDQFPSAIFISHAGRSLPGGLGPHLVPLAPGLGLDLELRYKADYLAAKKIVW